MGEFESLKTKVGKFSLADKTLLIPDMSRTGSMLIAAAMRAFGVDAQVMQTYKGLQLGKQYTSGKECFPCQITLGDLLHHMEGEKKRLGEAFRPENYLYFMAETEGPCRFGMYNKLHRLILDSLDGFSKTRIASITTQDSYALGGLMRPAVRKHFRRTAYVAVVIGDLLDRMLWRIRPYAKETNQAEAYLEEALTTMVQAVETHGRKKRFRRMLDTLEDLAIRARELIDPTIPPKPLIGMVGEIYLRTHRLSNQDLIRLMEDYGAEVVNASTAEWINYISYDRMQKAARDCAFALRRQGIVPLPSGSATSQRPGSMPKNGCCIGPNWLTSTLGWIRSTAGSGSICPSTKITGSTRLKESLTTIASIPLKLAPRRA
jgi:predicted nucleotide-binding protein (sugar kinase/HSP70/actin superfamily)